ncbi:MAG: polyphosphate kinase 1 [Candidatus Obscuribacterales bacterium]|nr:polyphosphate kinase 1 [Candidatus Obscuribacterales bacterium]
MDKSGSVDYNGKMTSSKIRQNFESNESADSSDLLDPSAKTKEDSQKSQERNSSGDAASSPAIDFAPGELLNLDDPSLYINRELSLLDFQKRVLEEAQDESNPLLERFKFLSIIGSNIEEFFMVRVAGLKRQLENGTVSVGPDGLSPSEQLGSVRETVKSLLEDSHNCLVQSLLPSLKQANILICRYEELSAEQRSLVQSYFLQSIFPVLTPLAFDPGHPFPHISNLSLNLAILILDNRGEERFARVKIPDTLPQLIAIDKPSLGANKSSSPNKQEAFIWLDDLISANLDVLFPGMQVLESHPFHVTRDGEVEIQEWEAEDLLETTEQGIRQRRFGDVVRLTVDLGMPEPLLEILTENLEIETEDVYRVRGRFPLSNLKSIYSLDRPDLKDPPFLPMLPSVLNPDTADDDIFAAIRKRDIMLHHPFDSFQPVINFLHMAARDPNVLAIKMTLYRVGRNSPVVEALLDAMRHGKQVAVLVELKARFDEESNIEWAKALEKEGVHIVYGLLGLKIHSKVALVVRREGDAIRRYVHLGTGNYNPVTAHLYTDIGLFTCDDEIGSDVTDLFNYLTGYSAKRDYRKLLVAPINMREQLEAFIRREIENHKAGKTSHIIFKLNALVDPGMIELLYEASRAGVKIDLIVRGACCLRPGIPGVSENIQVRSIVGRFLEHSRIYYFHNAGKDEIFLGSADLMPRNLYRRVEIIFPVRDPRLSNYLREDVLNTYLADHVKAREMLSDGHYIRCQAKAEFECINSQMSFLNKRPPWELTL